MVEIISKKRRPVRRFFIGHHHAPAGDRGRADGLGSRVSGAAAEAGHKITTNAASTKKSSSTLDTRRPSAHE
jgi:hypothetical protein